MDFDRMNRRRRMAQFRGVDWMDVVLVVCVCTVVILSVAWVAHQLSSIN